MFSRLQKRKATEKTVRIAFAGPEIAGHYSNLQAGFERIGIKTDLCTLPNRFDYKGNYSAAWQMLIYRKLSIKRAETPRTDLIRKIFLVILQSLYSKYFMPLWASYSYDVLFFGFGTTFSNSEFELKIYRFFSRKIIFTYMGTDARAAYLRGVSYPVGSEIHWDEIPSVTEKTKKRIRLIERYADHVMAFPGVSHLFSRKFIDITIMGNPVSIDECLSLPSLQSSPKGIKILHGPSAPKSKGSKQILEIINRLKERGYAIDYRPIHGVSNSDMRKAITECDFVVDCLWADCPAGVLAAEAAFLGKPVVIGGYFSSSVHSYYSDSQMPPYIFVEPDEVEASIERLIVDEGFRLRVGKSTQEYMMKNRRPEHIALKYLQIINSDIPDCWYMDPYEIFYLHGSGAPESHIKMILRGVIERYGVGALQLSDKPELEKAFVEFSGASID